MIPDGQRCYLDTNAFIYYAEMHAVFGPPVKALIERSTAGKLSLVTSELTLAEVLVLPYKLDRLDDVAQYELLLLSRPGLEVIPVSRSVLAASARLRASAGLRLPDAIHVATARLANCAVMISEDQRLGSSTTGSPRIVRISDLIPPPESTE